jgi:hypothetical protein
LYVDRSMGWPSIELSLKSYIESATGRSIIRMVIMESFIYYSFNQMQFLSI